MPRDVAGGGDDAAHAAADDHRAAGQLRPVALLDARVERVAIDMRDGEPNSSGMRDDPAGRRKPGTAAAAASPADRSTQSRQSARISRRGQSQAAPRTPGEVAVPVAQHRRVDTSLNT